MPVGPRDLATKVEAIAHRYPDRQSLTLPALRFAQEERGWLPPEALEEVAEVLDLTPAYCQAVASFYDMFHLEPVGRHMVEICTNLSCALVGAQRVVDAFEEALGVHAGETTEDGLITFRAASASAAAATRRSSRSTAATATSSSRRTPPESWRRSVALLEALLEDADKRDLTRLDEYRAVGGYEALVKARAMTPDAPDRGDVEREPARPRRCRLPDRPQGVTDSHATRRSRSTSSSTRTSRSRERSRTGR